MPVADVSSECPECRECDKTRFLDLPSVLNETNAAQPRHYSAYVLSLMYSVGIPEKYLDCFETPPWFISFVVIDSVEERDGGTFSLSITSSLNSRSNTFDYYTRVGR